MWRWSTKLILTREKLPVDFGRQGEVAFGDAAGVVRPAFDIGTPPREVNVRVVSHLLGNGPDAIHERERGFEVTEQERLRETVTAVPPIGQDGGAAGEFIAFQ